MFLAHLNLIFFPFIDDYSLTYQKNNKIYKHSDSEDMIPFDNSPLTGWKLEYRRDDIYLIHPHNPSIKFHFFDVENKLFKLNIQKGIIQEQIIITLNHLLQTSIAIEGTEEFEFALQDLDNEMTGTKFSVKDLQVGDIISIESSHLQNAISNVYYLGSFYQTCIEGQYNKVSFSSKKRHFIGFTEKNKYNQIINRVIGISSFKDIRIHSHESKLSDFNLKLAFENKNFDVDIPALIFKPANFRIYCFFDDNKTSYSPEDIKEYCILHNYYKTKPPIEDSPSSISCLLDNVL